MFVFSAENMIILNEQTISLICALDGAALHPLTGCKPSGLSVCVHCLRHCISYNSKHFFFGQTVNWRIQEVPAAELKLISSKHGQS